MTTTVRQESQTVNDDKTQCQQQQHQPPTHRQQHKHCTMPSSSAPKVKAKDQIY